MTLGEKSYQEAQYWNTNGMQISIVASITEGVDWAAYIGATANAYREQETVDWTLRHGAKLSASDARHYFPDIKLPYRD